MHASVQIRVTPSGQFSLSDTLTQAQKDQMSSYGCYDPVMFGALDIFVSRAAHPIGPFSLTIEDVDFNEVDSTPTAFRFAARVAAEKCLATLGS
jgi:hypothetical protein